MPILTIGWDIGTAYMYINILSSQVGFFMFVVCILLLSLSVDLTIRYMTGINWNRLESHRRESFVEELPVELSAVFNRFELEPYQSEIFNSY
jgi:uncharacterized membrane-anchored protein YitT (DUF2179 family)